MFGRRPDGRRIDGIDPVMKITPYVMPMRCDAQVFLKHRKNKRRESDDGFPSLFSHTCKLSACRSVLPVFTVSAQIVNRHCLPQKMRSVSVF